MDIDYKSLYYINDLSDHQNVAKPIDSYQDKNYDIFYKKYCINDLSDHQSDTYKSKYYKYKNKYIKQKSKNDFLDWFKTNKGFNNLIIKESKESGKKTIAKNDIKKDDILVKVPFDLMINYKNFINEEFIVELVNILINHKKNNIKTQYISYLPDDYSFLVHNWKKDKLDIVKNTSIFNDIIKSKSTKQLRFEKFKKKYGQKVTDEEFDWAYSCVTTRNFSIYKDNKKYNSLVPYSDLLNHSNENNSKWYFDEKNDSFMIKALNDIPKGEEVFVSYGFLDGKKSLTWYGFFLEDYHNIIVGQYYDIMML